MVENTLRMVDDRVPFRSVWASRGKVVRAEPISALYEQGRVHHVGPFARLEIKCAPLRLISTAMKWATHPTEWTRWCGD